MKHKYITIKVLLACLAKQPGIKKDIHAELRGTVAEHIRIMQQVIQLLSAEQDDEFTTQHKIAA